MDMYLLRYIQKKKGVSVKELCETIGVKDPSCWYKRLSGDVEWTLGDIRKLKNFLELTDQQLKEIFDL